MDWLTTIIGILYFGAFESNPFIGDIARTSLPAFTAIKLSTTMFVGLLFCIAEKILLRTRDRNSRSFQYTRMILRGACMATTVFLLVAVLNNLIVFARAI